MTAQVIHGVSFLSGMACAVSDFFVLQEAAGSVNHLERSWRVRFLCGGK